MRRIIEILRGRESKPRRQHRRPSAGRPQLTLESLETRKMLTGGISNVGDTIRVEATNDGDTIHVWTDLQNLKKASDDLVRVEWTHGDVTTKAAFPAGPVKHLQLLGGLSDDTITNDTNFPASIYGRRGDDKLTGGGVHDVIWGDDDNDVIDGRGGDDDLSGGTGSDVIHGGTSNDSIYGGTFAGNDNTVLDIDKLYGDSGNDRMQGSRGGTNYLYGGVGNDVLVGGFIGVEDNVNYLFGGDGNDALYGPGRVNFLDGGKGMDYLEVAYFSYNNTMFGGDDKEIDILSKEADGFDGIVITRPGDIILTGAKYATNWPVV